MAQNPRVLFSPATGWRIFLPRFSLTGKDLIARLWSYIENQLNKDPTDQEIAKQGIVTALFESLDHDGHLVCNQGKTKKAYN